MLVNERNPNLKNRDFDSDASLKEARSRRPLDRLMAEHGDVLVPRGPCPFCKKKGKARIKASGAQQFFKCFNPQCPSATSEKGKSWTEVAYLMFKLSMSKEDAFQTYLKMTGVWVERAQFKPPPGKEKFVGEDEQILLDAIEVIRAAGSASVSLLQRRLRLGYTRAGRIMDELERRKIVGPSKGAEPRDILNLPEPKPQSHGESSGPAAEQAAAQPNPTEQVGAPSQGDEPPEEVVAAEADATAEQKPPPPVEETPPPPPPPEPEPPPKVPSSHYDVLGVHAKATADEIKKAYRKLASEKHPDVNKAPNAHDEFVKIQAAYEILSDPAQRERYDRSRAASDPGPKVTADGSDKPKLAPGLGPLREFDSMLSFSEQDDNDLWVRRGVETVTNTRMGFKSNPRSNQVLIEQLIEKWGWDEMVASGLCLAANRKRKLDRRTNSQFHGKGQVGKKPESQRRDRNDKWVWGWNEPVLIPFVDERGELVKLRPHKGGAPAGTVAGRERLYIPRVVASARGDIKWVEKFYRVVICEGEFKAVALWQQVGGGRTRPGEPYGVCALPGITYGKNVELREELEEWLRCVGAREVIVAFDDEDKSGKPLRQRFDAVRWAKYLAVSLRKKLGVNTRVANLPREWRNEKGKADWDGALAQLFKTKHPTSNE